MKYGAPHYQTGRDTPPPRNFSFRTPHSAFSTDLEDHLAQLEARRYSPSRLTHARRTIEMLILYLRENYHLTDWRAVSEHHLSAFAVFAATRHRTPKGKPISASTLRQWLSMLRVFFAWMRADGRLIADPAERLLWPRRDHPLPRALSQSQIRRLIETPDTTTAPGLRDRALMEALYATGIRRAEACKLDLYDVDTASAVLVVRQGKGSRDRIVPLTECASYWLTRYLTAARPELAAGFKRARRGRKTNPQSDLSAVAGIRIPQSNALWLSLSGRRLSYPAIGQIIRNYARQAEVNASAHTFRHSCATHLLRGGASIRHVQQLLGHQGLDTTEIYTRVEIEDLKRAVGKASDECKATSDEQNGEWRMRSSE